MLRATLTVFCVNSLVAVHFTGKFPELASLARRIPEHLLGQRFLVESLTTHSI